MSTAADARVLRTPRRRRRWRKIALWVIGVGVVLRALLGWCLPWLLERTARSAGLALTIEGSALSLVGGSLELRGVTLASADAAAVPIATVALVRADVDMTALLAGSLRVHRAEVDGVQLVLTREADGTLRWPAPAPGNVPAPPRPAAAARSPPTPLALDFSLPFAVTSAHVSRVQVNWTDAAVTPPLAAELTFSAAVFDVGHATRPARVHVDLAARDVVDALRLRAQVRGGRRTLVGQAHLDLAGVRWRALAPYLLPLGLRGRGERSDARVELRTDLAPRADDIHGAQGEVSCRAHLDEDGVNTLALDDVRVSVEQIDTTLLRCRAALAGVRLRAGRAADGAFALPGVDLLPAAGAAPAPAPPPPSCTLRAALAQLDLEDLRVDWHDAATQPAVYVAVTGSLHASGLSGEMPHAAFAARADLALEHVAQRVTLDARGQPRGATTEVTLAAQGDGITLAAIAPYLHASGLRSTLVDGALALRASATLAAAGDLPHARLDRCELRDGAREWLVVEGVDVLGLRQGAAGLTIDRIAVAGVRAQLERDAHGILHAAGMALLAAAPAGADAQVRPPPVPRAPATFTLHELQCTAGPLLWRDAALGTSAPQGIVLATVQANVNELVAGAGLPTWQSARLALSAPGLVEEVTVAAAAHPKPSGTVLTGEVGVGRFTPDLVVPYLTEAGVQPTFARADARLTLAAQAQQTAGGADLSVTGGSFQFRADDDVLAQVRGCSLGPSSFGAGGTVLGALDVDAPTVRIARDDDGSIVCAGWRLLAQPAVPRAEAMPRVAPPTRPIVWGPVQVRGAELQWRDAAVVPPFAADVQIDAQAHDLVATRAQPLTLTAHTNLLPGDGTLAVAGHVSVEAGVVDVAATLGGDALQLARVQAYMPPQVRLLPAAHDVATRLRVSVGAATAGGRRIDVTVPEFTVRDDASGQALLTCRDIAFRAARIDPAAAVYEIEALTAQTSGIKIVRTAAGLHLPLLMVVDAPGSAAPPAAERPAGAAAAAPPPRLSVAGVDLSVDGVQWQDLTQPSAALATIAVRVQHADPFVLLTPDADDEAPSRLRITAGAPPILDELTVDLQWTPAPAEPRLAVELHGKGVHADGLTAVVPQLATRLDATLSTLREVTAKAEVALRLPRAGLATFHPSDGFAAEFSARDVALRAADGRVCAGFGALAASIPRVLPRTGDVHIKAIELDDVRGEIERIAAGWRVAGLLWKTAPPAPAAQPAATAPPPPTPPATATPPAELRIDALSISGLDFVLRDHTQTPPALLPLTGLDVDVKGFTTRALAQPREMTFQASINGGKVALPERRRSSSVVSGVVGAVADVVAGTADQFAREERALFDELAVQGRLRLSPSLSGWARVDLGALELPALAPLLRDAGITLGDGLLDSRVGLRFRDDGVTSVDSAFDFTYLSLSEPPDGPISNYLRLPVPLDAVLFALKNADDEHKIPLTFDVTPDGVSAGQIAMSAVSALGQLIARAVAAAPLRAAGTVTGLMGLGAPAADASAADASPAELEFAPGDGGLHDAHRAGAAFDQVLAQLADLAAGVIVLEHALGTDDVPRAGALANPDPQHTLALVAGLRQHARTLHGESAQLAHRARSELLLGVESKDTLAALRSVETELMTNEVALGNVLDLLRPGAERRAGARTRAACRALGELRLFAVRRALLQHGGEACAERVEVRRSKPEPQEPLLPRGRVRLLVKPRA